MRRVDEHTTESYAELYEWLEPGELTSGDRARELGRRLERGERGLVRMTVAEHIVAALARQGVTTVWGVVGDALNPVTDAIRRHDGIDWIGVRHEEAGAFAASAQAQLTGTLAVCMGTVGPGSIHLLNGLYDAKKSHAPVLALCGQVPLAELGTDFFQEVDNDALFADVAVVRHTITSPQQLPNLLEHAVQGALTQRGVAVLTLPGRRRRARPAQGHARRALHRPAGQGPARPAGAARGRAAHRPADKVTLLAGIGAREAREEVLALAEKLSAPMVLTLKAKEGLERDNPFQVGQTGLIGNPAARHAFDECDLLLMLGTDFPYTDWYPEGKVVVQVDAVGAHIGRRTQVDAGVVGDAGLTAAALLDRVQPKPEPRPPRGRHRPLRALARRAAQARRPRLRGQRHRAQAAVEVRQPRHADPPGGPGRRGRRARRRRRDLHLATPACPPSGSRASSSSPAPAA